MPIDDVETVRALVRLMEHFEAEADRFRAEYKKTYDPYVEGMADAFDLAMQRVEALLEATGLSARLDARALGRIQSRRKAQNSRGCGHTRGGDDGPPKGMRLAPLPRESNSQNGNGYNIESRKTLKDKVGGRK